jgi:plastocyanin
VKRLPIADCRFAIGLLLIVGCVCSIGCDNDASSAKGSDAAPPRVQVKTGTGIVRGVVKFDGTPPKMATIANKPCHAGAKEIEEETVIVGEAGALMNAFVFVEGAGTDDGSKREPAVLDQVHCRYVPHVVGVQVGQTLNVRSSDDTMHNVHYKPDRNAAANLTMTRPGAQKQVTFAAPEFIRVKCDVHPWMTAYVGVFDTPFFAATGVDGTFEIKGLPAGEYTLVAWHELYGRQQQPLTVADETKPVEATFRYKAP